MYTITIMKRNYKIILTLVLLSVTYTDSRWNDGDPDKDKLLLELLTFVIEKVIIIPQLLMIISLRESIKIILRH
jgi:hypothetical protein